MGSFTRERKRILLVEDERDARKLVEFTLAEYTLISARDIDEGMRFAYLRYFDLYLLDKRLPSGSGVELCRLIRGFDPHTPILFYSAAAYARDIWEAMQAGAQAYLVKPVIPDELRRTVAQLLSAAHEKAFEARRVEIAAVREDLAVRRMEIAERLEKAKQKHLRAEEKVLRDKAQIAFLAAGGTRGDFVREWPSVFLEEVRCARASAAVGGR